VYMTASLRKTLKLNILSFIFRNAGESRPDAMRNIEGQDGCVH
jgi:hypothetical protein